MLSYNNESTAKPKSSCGGIQQMMEPESIAVYTAKSDYTIRESDKNTKLKSMHHKVRRLVLLNGIWVPHEFIIKLHWKVPHQCDSYANDRECLKRWEGSE